METVGKTASQEMTNDRIYAAKERVMERNEGKCGSGRFEILEARKTKERMEEAEGNRSSWDDFCWRRRERCSSHRSDLVDVDVGRQGVGGQGISQYLRGNVGAGEHSVEEASHVRHRKRLGPSDVGSVTFFHQVVLGVDIAAACTKTSRWSKTKRKTRKAKALRAALTFSWQSVRLARNGKFRPWNSTATRPSRGAWQGISKQVGPNKGTRPR